jgi:chloramphenicol 3-O-phosphotransferase
MEEREILRGDRTRGLARAQNTKIKNLNWDYDLEIDTNLISPFTNAKKILQFLKKN